MQCNGWHGLTIDSGFHVKLIGWLHSTWEMNTSHQSSLVSVTYLHFICVPHFDCCVITGCDKHACIKREPWYWGDSILVSIRPIAMSIKTYLRFPQYSIYLDVLAIGSFLMWSAGIASKSNTCTLPSAPPDSKLYSILCVNKEQIPQFFFLFISKNSLSLLYSFDFQWIHST